MFPLHNLQPSENLPTVSGSPLPLTFWHWAGVSPYTSSFDLAQTCVFGKQSLGSLRCDPLAGAPLLPKLRGYFA